MSLRVTILGCGSSGGVPRIGGSWGSCDPANPKNRRMRCAALFERVEKSGRTAILVDTPPDLREQLLSVRCSALDAVLFTHDHADHTHGIDDLRGIAYAMKRRVPCYMDAPTRANLEERFSYCFKAQPGSGYAPILTANDLTPGGTTTITGGGGLMIVTSIRQQHGDIGSLGFRVGGVAYSPDLSDIPPESVPLLEGLDLWIVDALRPLDHPSHFGLKQAMSWIERLNPKRAILTHMTAELDYDTLQRDLPPHIAPAYDGMVIELP